MKWALEYSSPQMGCDMQILLLSSILFICLGVRLEALTGADPCKKIKFLGLLVYLPYTTHLIAVGIQPVSNRCITELCFSSTTDTIPVRLKTDQ